MFLISLIISGCIQKEALTPDKVIEQSEALENQRISVMGVAGVYRLICTQKECFLENPCCNICSGSLVLRGMGKKIILTGKYDGADVKCTGNDCEQECYPLKSGKKYEVIGLWKKVNDQYKLYLEDFKEL
jgi:hypothetical protein